MIGVWAAMAIVLGAPTTLECLPRGATVRLPGGAAQKCGGAVALPGSGALRVEAPGYETVERPATPPPDGALRVALSPELARLDIEVGGPGEARVGGDLRYPLPVRDVALLPGRVDLVVKRPGCPDWREHVAVDPGGRVRVEAGKDCALELTESGAEGRPLGGVSILTSSPAQVVFRGAVVARTPLTTRAVPEGEYAFTLRFEGHPDERLEMVVRRGESVTETVELVPVEAGPSVAKAEDAADEDAAATAGAAATAVSVAAPAAAAAGAAAPAAKATAAAPAPAPGAAAPTAAPGAAAPGAKPSAGATATAPAPVNACVAFDAPVRRSTAARLARLECGEAEGASEAERAACERARAAVDDAIARGDLAAAYAAWWTEAPRKGAGAPLPRGADRAFAREAEATRREAASPRVVAYGALAKRAVLGDGRGAAALVPDLEAALCASGQRLNERAAAARDWNALGEVAGALAWIERARRGPDPSPEPAPVAALARRGARGGYARDATAWADLERSGPESLRVVAGRARTLAALEAVRAAQQEVASGRHAAAAGTLARARALDPETPEVAAAVEALAPKIASARARHLKALATAADPRALHRETLAIDAIDAICGGPASSLAPEVRAASLADLEAVATGGLAAAWERAAGLRTEGADHLEAAKARLSRLVWDWALREVKRLRGARAFVEAESRARAVLERLPGDEALQAAADDVASLARAERVARAEALLRAGHVALGLLTLRFDARITQADRDHVLAMAAPLVAAYEARLRPAPVLVAVDPFAARTAAVIDLEALPTGGIRVGAGAPEAAPLHPVTLRVRVVELRNDPARRTQVESATSRYVAGRIQVSNPAKAECEQRVMELEGQLAEARSSYDEAYYEYTQCMESARNAASAGAGWAALAGATVCTAAHTALGTMVEDTARELRDERGECGRTPDVIQEEQWAEMPYSVETWGLDAAAHLEVTLLDGDHVLWTKSIDARIAETDRVVAGQPQFDIPEDTNDLPGTARVEARLLESLRAGLAAALAEGAGQAWRAIRRSADAAPDETARRERLARLVLLAEGLDTPGPELEAQVREVLAAVPSWTSGAQEAAAAPPK